MTRSITDNVGLADTRRATMSRAKYRPIRNAQVPPMVAPVSARSEPLTTPNTAPPSVQPPRNPFRGVKQCKSKRPPEPVSASRFFTILSESITQSTLVQYYQLKWQGWDKPTN